MMLDPEERKVILDNRKFVREGHTVDENDADSDNSSDRPEDNIPDLPENKAAREFLKNAPSKGSQNMYLLSSSCY